MPRAVRQEEVERMRSRGLHRILYTLLSVGSLVLVLATAGPYPEATPITPETFGTVQSPIGFQLTPSYPNIVVTGPQVIEIGPNPITLGSFGPHGEVVGGDAVLMAFLDLGTAPVQQVILPSTNGSEPIFVTPATPRASGVTNTAGFILPPDFPGFGLQFPAGAAPIGAEGDLFIGFALLEHADQPLTEALGVVVPFRVRIGEPQGFVQEPEGTIFLTKPMTFGGASFFAPRPESVLASYTFASIDFPGAAFTQAFGINEAGKIVGSYGDGVDNFGFLLANGSFSTLAEPSASFTQAYDINAPGKIVGWDNTASARGFLVTSGTFSSIMFPGAISTDARGINNRGQIVGGYSDATGGHGYLFDGVNFSTIDGPGAVTTVAFGINDPGQIVGYFTDAIGTHGFLLRGDRFTIIDAPGSSNTQALGINNRGQITGTFVDASGVHGFVMDANGFATIDFPGGTGTAAYKANNRGQIVGTYNDATGAHGFLAAPVHRLGRGSSKK